MENRRKSGRYEDSSEDWPTYSRLFIVCEKRITEEQLRSAFAEFGTIEDIRMPRDHNTGEPKGVAYIKFSRTTEAANALEAMNFKSLQNSNRPLKVMVAANRSDIHSDDQDTEKYRRLFISSDNASENDLHEEFSNFGDVERVTIQRHRDTGTPKGFAYIKFRKFSQAARAMEECHKKYRALFAQPKQIRRPETSFESNINSLALTSANMRSSMISMMNSSPGGFTRIHFRCSPLLTQGYVERIFDLVPGMEECMFVVDLVRNFGKGVVRYSNAMSASYAVEKLDKFEYPPGMKIYVRPVYSQFGPQEANFSDMPNVMNQLKTAIDATNNSRSPDLAQLAEAIAEASKLIKMATAGVTDDIPDSSDLKYCSTKLPSPKPLADIDSRVAKRCFLVCKPQPPPLTVLRDVFCRFGDLINVYTLPNKTVGYARYATVEAADEAIKCLHGAEICGVRIKVIEADEKPEDYDEASNKRMKYGY